MRKSRSTAPRRRNSSRPHAQHVKRGDALLITDVINDLEFPGGEKVLPWAARLAPRLVKLRTRMHTARLPVIYANDNFGLWHGGLKEVLAHCTRPAARARKISQQLAPSSKDYFILKPRHSAFFATSLFPMLEDLQIERLLIAGIATNLCVLFTAHDAHMHRFPLVVISDCCAAESNFDHNIALSQLKRFCGATVCTSTELKFE